MKKPSIFEHSTCGKCGGDGLYHAPSGYGRHCFGCGGKGYKLSARGAAASRFLTNLLSKPLSELKVGDKYYYQGFSCGSFVQPSCWVTVEKIVALPRIEAVGGEKYLNGLPADEIVYKVEGDHSGIQWIGPDHSFRVSHTNEQKREKQMLALAYQSYLNKNGSPNVKAILSEKPVDASLAEPYMNRFKTEEVQS
jgi:hypothetical protein